jgi:pyocin large subunit-like protein
MLRWIAPLIFAATAIAGGPGFRTQHLLEEHYARYRTEFGAISEEQYLHYAQQLRDSRPGKSVLESRRADRSGVKFDKRRGWFVAYDGDGTIRTFFIPKDGVRYFERQAKTSTLPE